MTNAFLELDSVRRAADRLIATDDSTVAVQVELSEIPAPPFDEGARAQRMAELLSEAGVTGVRRDEVGNVLGTRAGTDSLPPLIVSAHLDTVFPAGTQVAVQREGDFLRGPGISDDARGLATLVSLARALEAEGIRTRTPLLFAATVGEEGIGDLRGVKHLFAGGAGSRAGGFVSLDGAGLERIVARGLCSRRYRVEVTGPGGHSWADWGTPNPIHAVVDMGRQLTEFELPDDPRTTLTIARIGGGKSINAIPQTAWLEIDTRSADPTRVATLERSIGSIAERAAVGGLRCRVEVIGDRPGGSTPEDALLVQAALDATRWVGRHPMIALSSTDANVPMSLGIPAITIGCGGEAGMAHTTDEWYRNVDGTKGVLRALYTVLVVAGLEA